VGSTVKVPRLVGKKGSMISMIKDRTGCSIYVGQNGVAWVSGKNLQQVEEIINKIEKESHKEGLTDSIEKMLGGPKMTEKTESFEEFNEEVGDNGV
jgi:exosome complex component RRP4